MLIAACSWYWRCAVLLGWTHALLMLLLWQFFRICSWIFIGAAKTAETNGVVAEETIRRAFLAAEEGFHDVVSQLWSTRPQIATVGSCCLVGMISHHTLFVANLGDSRAVLGRKNTNTGSIDAVQLTTDHNANVESVRRELMDLHPDDPQIVMLKHGIWRVKGIIQVR